MSTLMISLYYLVATQAYKASTIRCKSVTEHSLLIQIKKFQFLKLQLAHLGHIVEKNGVCIDP